MTGVQTCALPIFDIPEVSLVAILDADKEGFLRSGRSLIQTIGRAARNARGEVILYADRMTAAMQHAMGETSRRRQLQTEYNLQRGITPETVRRAIDDSLLRDPSEADYVAIPVLRAEDVERSEDAAARLDSLRAEMLLAAEQLDFERAAKLRDRIASLSGKAPEPAARRADGGGRGRKRGRR